MAKRRYVAPARGAVAPGVFDHPVFAGFAAHRAWLDGVAWPSLDALNCALAADGAAERVVAQDAALLSDGEHYELRIARRGHIATRPDNWHDLLNALVWIEHPSLKRALNRRQVAEIAQVGPAQRSRAQCALTHFDEGGAIVVLRDAALLPLWDAHDWHGLFWRERAAWFDGRIDVIVFGHALLEHALTPGQLITAKCIAVLDIAGASGRDELRVDTRPRAMQRASLAVAEATARGVVFVDPQELRPLPLSGIPGWHAGTDDEAFYRNAECFRPLRPGRVYPAPRVLQASDEDASDA
ncbi:DUF3025 domain-containing protein [Chiayiivirga flava]|uniref:DUF3025 domain-containing protein n=1 Tax=Chiayiivirga flava TaxID=659595 RepID=A0A7W8FY38_9GAMM|nr:DUF3025 domain-containing protein [Chiayiivirga flava]MBB5206691.1 hypothetical protein [Chiayiivirga flava]